MSKKKISNRQYYLVAFAGIAIIALLVLVINQINTGIKADEIVEPVLPTTDESEILGSGEAENVQDFGDIFAEE